MNQEKEDGGFWAHDAPQSQCLRWTRPAKLVAAVQVGVAGATSLSSGATSWSAGSLRETTMKLYVTFTSPYARLARIVVVEKGLQERVEVIGAQTRTQDSPYYTINPSGRVPYL